MSNKLRIFLGWDAREAPAYAVAARSIRARTSQPVDIQPISMGPLRDNGWYHRPTEARDGRLWDVFSDAPMSTEHAIARFFVPQICEFRGWALFADCDILCRADIADIFALADSRYALMCVQHDFWSSTRKCGVQLDGYLTHSECDTCRAIAASVGITGIVGKKMDGQAQTAYPKKLWSSVCLWNCDHPAHRALTLNHLNTWAGRDLHGFRWLWDAQIGALPSTWNHLVGIDPPNQNAKIAHFTLGTCDLPGYEDCEFSDEWREYIRQAVA